jgi:hypothetical protein
MVLGEVTFRHRQASPASHQGPRLPRRRCRDGVQAHRISTDPVAGRQRTHLVALVRAGAVFKNGKLIERPDESEGW